jgi:hypothetical protein
MSRTEAYTCVHTNVLLTEQGELSVRSWLKGVFLAGTGTDKLVVTSMMLDRV